VLVARRLLCLLVLRLRVGVVGEEGDEKRNFKAHEYARVQTWCARNASTCVDPYISSIDAKIHAE